MREFYTIEKVDDTEARIFYGKGRKRVEIGHLTKHPRSPKDLLERAERVIEVHRSRPKTETIVRRF